MRADMGAALPDQQAFDLCTANGAEFTRTPIDIKMILEIPAAICPINACAIMVDTFLYDKADRVQQAGTFFLCNCIRAPERVQFRPV